MSQNNGTHIFSKDFESHNKAVQAFQVNSKARQGKSSARLQKERGGNLQETGAQVAEPPKLKPAPPGGMKKMQGSQTKGPSKQPEAEQKIKR